MSATKRSNKSNAYCCVPQCKTYYEEKISFHKFPNHDKHLRAKWIDALKIGRKVSPYMVVCSNHFRNEDFFFNRQQTAQKYRLKLNVVPSRNLPQSSHQSKCKENLQEQRQKRTLKRQIVREKFSMANLETQDLTKDVDMTNALTQVEHEVADTLLSLSGKTEANTEEKTSKVEFVDKGVQVNTYEDFNSFDVSDIIDTDYKLRTLTGILNLALLNVWVKVVSDLIENKSKFSTKKLVLLTFMRLKLDVPFTSLGVLFNISPTTAQTYFRKIIKILSFSMKPLIRFSSQKEIESNTPLCFKSFEIQKSHCLKCRIKAYSFYKSRHTVKFLIGSAPSGLITFVSRAYGGRASDKAIFNKENLISKLTPGDAVMVDKGFLIDNECEKSGVTLIRPPFLRNKKQLSKEDAKKTAEIARARAHIQRVIQRIKNFRICRNVLPGKIAPYINDIITVILVLTNLSNPILSNDKF